MNTRRATLVIVRAGALALLAACGGNGSPHDAATGGGGNDPIAGACSPSAPPMPVTHIGPDITLRALCGQEVASEFASVDDRGGGIISWSLHLESTTPAVFGLTNSAFQSCHASIATIAFQPPVGAVPGDTFDGIVTVHADDGSFPDGTVNVHGEVVAPIVAVDPPTLELGDVLPGTPVTRPLVFFVANDLGSSLVQFFGPSPPFGLEMRPFTRAQPNVSSWVVTFEANIPGDYLAAIPFQTAHSPAQPEACEWSTTFMVHARVVGDAGTPDGGADASDAGG